MKIIIHDDLALVIDFMRRSMPASHLRPVAHALAKYADLEWGRFSDPGTKFVAFREDLPPLDQGGLHEESGPSGS